MCSHPLLGGCRGISRASLPSVWLPCHERFPYQWPVGRPFVTRSSLCSFPEPPSLLKYSLSWISLKGLIFRSAHPCRTSRSAHLRLIVLSSVCLRPSLSQ